MAAVSASLQRKGAHVSDLDVEVHSRRQVKTAESNVGLPTRGRTKRTTSPHGCSVIHGLFSEGWFQESLQRGRDEVHVGDRYIFRRDRE